MRVLLINPSYPFEEFPRLLVTLPYVAVGAARRGPRGRDPRPAARAHDARQDRAAHGSASGPQVVGITSVTLNHHIAECDRRGRAQVRRARADRDGRPARRRSRSRARSGVCRRSTTSRSARASTRCVELRARARGPHGPARRARARAASTRDTGRVWKNAPRPLEDDLDTLPESRARSGAARALPRLRQPRERRHEPRLPVRVHLLLGAGLDRPQGPLPHAVALRGRDRGPGAPRLHRDHDRGRSLHALPQALPRGLRRADAPQHRDPLERLLARGHDHARDRRDDGATPAARRSASASRAATRRSSTWSRSSSSLAKVKEAMRMTQDAGISALASFIVGLPGETEETLRKTVEFANELQQRVRLALRLPHPVAVPGHRGARARPPTTASRS